MSVGGYLTAGTSGPVTHPLAERWNGLAWVIEPTPIPADSYGGNLSGVSCTSARACTAVGLASRAGTAVPLVERWNGQMWVVQPAPAPAGALSSAFEAVSCTSTSACTAVGTYQVAGGQYATFAEASDGTDWKVQPTPDPGGSNHLRGVSCTSASACTAVGNYDSFGRELPLVERWDGTAWTFQAAPNPAGQSNAPLDEVSCASATACTTVGASNIPGVSAPTAFAEHWDGTTWTIQPVPSPAQALGTQLHGVSCPSVSVCTAVGLYYDSASTDATLAERYS